MKILLIDNYDSFSYNLYQFIGCAISEMAGGEIETYRSGAEYSESVEGSSTGDALIVIRNDELSVDQIRELHPDRIVISPGPGRPEDAGVIIDVVKELGGEIPILGICLGHQAICAAYGGTITYANKMMHGKQSMVSFFRGCKLFEDCPSEAKVARYHSLALDPDTIPDCLMVTAVTEDGDSEGCKSGEGGEIMAVQHKEYPVYGLQFHPESIMTPDGMGMIRRFLAE